MGVKLHHHECLATRSLLHAAASHGPLSEFQRSAIVAFHAIGMPDETIAQKMMVDKRTVKKWIERAHEDMNLHDLQRSGRHLLLTADEMNDIYARTKFDPTDATPPRLFDELSLDCSFRTIRRSLDRMNLKAHVARRAYPFTAIHLQKRLSFANGYLHWTSADWSAVLFSDETIFTTNNYSTRWCQREPNTDFLPENTVPHRAHPPKVNAWGCCSAGGVGTLYTFPETLNAQYMRSILDSCLLESAEKLFRLPMKWYLLQDNSRNHTAPPVKEWLHNHGVSVVEFPPYSPDLNIIENVWANVKRRISEHRAQTEAQLQDAAHEEWAKTDVKYLSGLVRSMHRRCEKVIEAKGFRIGY